MNFSFPDLPIPIKRTKCNPNDSTHRMNSDKEFIMANSTSIEKHRSNLVDADEERGEVNTGGKYRTFVPIDEHTTLSESPFRDSDRVFDVSTSILASAVWLSMLMFAVYIYQRYLATLVVGNFEAWGAWLSAPNSPIARSGMGLHFIGGSTLLILGNIQLLPGIRRRYPAVHRWLGRVYAGISMVTASGGLIFIILHGCVGGITMNIGFAIYGLLMFYMAVQTAQHARARRFDKHREWAIRLYSLAIASWLYRIEFTPWLVTSAPGHLSTYRGWFDKMMDFGFYIPNLILVEYILRVQRRESKFEMRGTFAGIFVFISMFLLYAAYLNWLMPVFGGKGLIDQFPPKID